MWNTCRYLQWALHSWNGWGWYSPNKETSRWIAIAIFYIASTDSVLAERVPPQLAVQRVTELCVADSWALQCTDWFGALLFAPPNGSVGTESSFIFSFLQHQLIWCLLLVTPNWSAPQNHTIPNYMFQVLWPTDSVPSVWHHRMSLWLHLETYSCSPAGPSVTDRFGAILEFPQNESVSLLPFLFLCGSLNGFQFGCLSFECWLSFGCW